jgi:hypothetical protein
MMSTENVAINDVFNYLGSADRHDCAGARQSAMAGVDGNDHLFHAEVLLQ